MNQMLRNRIASGMGGLGDNGFTTDAQGRIYRPDGSLFYDPNPTGTRPRTIGGSIVFQLPSVTPTTNSGQPPPGVTPEQWAAFLRAQAGGGNPAPRVGIHFGKDGIVFGDGSDIKYTTLMLVGVAIFLIQSRGFERKAK